MKPISKILTSFFLLTLLMISVQSFAASEVLATVNGEPITEDQIDSKIKNSMMKVESQIYEIKRDAIDDMISDKLLEKQAKSQGLTVDQLLKKEVEDKVKAPTEDEAKAMYEMYKKKFNGKTYEQVSDNLKNMILNQKKQAAMNDYLSQLKKNAKIDYKIERPTVNVGFGKSPAVGSPNAPVKIIEFSDYQCPFCKRARPTVNQILSTYKDKVYYVFRNFPLSFHNQAKDSANAALCAGEQNKYFEFNKELWDVQGNQTEDTFKTLAGKLGLDVNKFDECFKSQKFYKQIEQDQAEGLAAGVTGTPAYFINGKFLNGAQPFENFKEIIDEELAKSAKK